MDPSRTSRVTACLAALAFVMGTMCAQTAAADDQLELKALVGTWVWDHKPSCSGCKPFTVTLSVAAVSPDGTMRATYRSPQVSDGVSTAPRATITDGRITVPLKVGRVAYNLEYVKPADSLRGPVEGFPPHLLIRDATFRREK